MPWIAGGHRERPCGMLAHVLVLIFQGVLQRVRPTGRHAPELAVTDGTVERVNPGFNHIGLAEWFDGLVHLCD